MEGHNHVINEMHNISAEGGKAMLSLRELCMELDERKVTFRLIGSDSDVFIIDAFSDSRRPIKGGLFCCVKGEHLDGHLYAKDAIRAGAAAILCERELPDVDVPQLVVSDARKVMGLCAAIIHGYPAEKLMMLGVTGTNGKSTTTILIKSFLESRGIRCGLLGTIFYSDGEDEPADRTTPEGPEIQRWLSKMVKKGCEACAMEASSHGLQQGRLEGCRFDGAVFTNLTPEHLDYHGDMESYFKAKSLLFEIYMKEDWRGASNADDPYGKRLLSRYPDRLLPYSLKGPIESGVWGLTKEASFDRLTMDIFLPGGQSLIGVHIPMIGLYNAYNVLAAVTMGWSLSIPLCDMKKVLENAPLVPGRMERYVFPNGPCCVIDYAHTPDALENVLKALKEVGRGRLIAVFGAGGERFAENRPKMGEVAARLADFVMVTMDNPRGEDPNLIAEQIVTGIRASGYNTPYEVILNRAEAVYAALDMASEGDVVLLAGKGPEQYIIIGKERIPYSDLEAVKSWAQKRNLNWNPAKGAHI